MKTVKIDSVLLKKIEKFLNKPENKIVYVNKKHFIDLIVSEFFKKQEKQKRYKSERTKVRNKKEVK